MEITNKPSLIQRLLGRQAQPTPAPALPSAPPPLPGTIRMLDYAPNDPLVAYFQSNPGVVELERLNLDSPALRELHKADVKLVIPLLSQGELLGVVNLGPRLSDQDYSSDDRALLNNLATSAGPAVRVAQLVRQQQLEALARE